MLAVFAACGKDCVDDNQDELQVVKENSDVNGSGRIEITGE